MQPTARMVVHKLPNRRGQAQHHRPTGGTSSSRGGGGGGSASADERSHRSYDDHHHHQAASGLTPQMHPSWPELPQGQSELFYECTLFLYSVLALFLQYLNLYKTMWWLPKSYWHYSMKIHLINPYLLSCVGLLLGLRVTKCFWNTITDLLTAISAGASQRVLAVVAIVEWALVKSPMFTMVASSFLFSFSRVYHDFPGKSLLYFGHPLLFFFMLFHTELAARMHYYHEMIKGFWDSPTTSNQPNQAAKRPPTALVDIEAVVHMCSQSPSHIREEVDVLIADLYLRLKHCVFAALSTAYLSIVIPCVFVPEPKTWTPALGGDNGPPTMLLDYVWVSLLGITVTLTSFALYAVYLLPVQYCDLLHRSASHLGCWERFEAPPAAPVPTHLPPGMVPLLGAQNQQPGAVNCPSWSPSDSLWSNDSVVRYGSHLYKACARKGMPGVAAEPGNSDHWKFFFLSCEPQRLIGAQCYFQALLIGCQFWLLMITSDWQRIVTIVLLMFANYTLLWKVFKDRIVAGRIYHPTQEDQQLIRQLQQATS